MSGNDIAGRRIKRDNELLDLIARLTGLAEAIDALHQPMILGACQECNHLWPCRTHVLLHPEEKA